MNSEDEVWRKKLLSYTEGGGRFDAGKLWKEMMSREINKRALYERIVISTVVCSSETWAIMVHGEGKHLS